MVQVTICTPAKTCGTVQATGAHGDQITKALVIVILAIGVAVLIKLLL